MSTSYRGGMLPVSPGDILEICWLDAQSEWLAEEATLPLDGEMGAPLRRVGILLEQTRRFLYLASEVDMVDTGWRRHTLQVPKSLLLSVRILGTKKRVL